MNSVLVPGVAWPKPALPPVPPTRQEKNGMVIIDWLALRPWSRLAQVGEGVGMTRQAVGRILSRLADEGLVEGMDVSVKGKSYKMLAYRVIE